MSRAFIKEDTDEPERFVRRPSAAGLPPGAVNYMTADGVERLRQLRPDREMQAILDAATVIAPREEIPDEVLFGTTVILKKTDETMIRQRIVGVAECDVEPHWISWLSPQAKTLLGLRVGSRVHLPGMPAGEKAEIMRIES